MPVFVPRPVKRTPSWRTALLAAALGLGGASTASADGATAPNPIRHVFVIVKENHTYDDYFGTFPGGNGATSARNSHGRQVALTAPSTNSHIPGDNSWDAAHLDYDRGAMDGFDRGEIAPIWLVTNGPFSSYSGTRAISYYTTLAKKGVLCDAFFTSVMGPSTPNHLFLLAATSGGAISDPSLLTGNVTVLDASGRQRSHPGSFSPSEIRTTIPNQLEAAGLTWAYYDEYSPSNVLEAQGDGVAMIQVFNTLPSFPARFVTSVGQYDRNLAWLLATGPVGNVTYIHPAVENSDHPLFSSVADGATWTKRVVNQIAASRFWNDCAIFITWDDYGGFYDHVAPTPFDAFGPGFRVPCLLISPYARAGVVDHTKYELSSIVKFCESTFHLPAMTARDAAASDMRAAFDFSKPPRPASDFYVP